MTITYEQRYFSLFSTTNINYNNRVTDLVTAIIIRAA